MAERHEGRRAIEDRDRSASLFDWEVSIARARERAVALRSSHAGDTKDVNEAAYDELALSFEELTVAQEELRTLNDQVTDATARIEQERRRYHELFLAAPVPYIVTDKHGVIREVNHAASRLLRRNADALSGKPLAVFVDETSRRRVRRAIFERGTSPGTSNIRFGLSPREAPAILAEATLSSVAESDADVHEIRWLVVDRTRALRQARARRSRAEELGRLVAARTAELDDAQRLKDRLVSTVSHEFRTGLAAIGGYAELLELGIHGPLTDVQMSDIRRIRSAYEHLSLVVEDLLSYGKIVAGRLSVEVADVEVGEAIRGMAGLVGPQSQDKSIRVELNGPGESVVARADAERLRQILLNVTGNAIKFSPRRSRIVIGWQSQADAVLVAITDSGPGVPEAERESIFQPFSRLENSRSVPGTGLGLAISRELARAMGGDLTVEQNPDGPGSCFNLRLPRSTPLAPGDASVR